MTDTILKKSIVRPDFAQSKIWLAAAVAISACLAELTQPVASQGTSPATLGQLLKRFETCAVDREALRFKPVCSGGAGGLHALLGWSAEKHAAVRGTVAA